jgi:hypothetical protein
MPGNGQEKQLSLLSGFERYARRIAVPRRSIATATSSAFETSTPMMVMVVMNNIWFSSAKKEEKREERREMHDGARGGMMSIALLVI